MNYALVVVHDSASHFPPSQGYTKRLGSMQPTPISRYTCECADRIGATRSAIPDNSGIDAESIRDDERQRIARDIHDELGQQLLVLRIDVLRLCKRIDNTLPDLEGLVGTVRRQLDITTLSLRAVIRGLRPAELDGGLRAAVEAQCAQFHQHFGIVCNLTWNADNSVLTDSSALVLFRVLQEALTNVQRHAQASCVRITLDSETHRIVMTIVDNGIGSMLTDHLKPNAYGLFGMRERITALGGQLAITSDLQEGTRLTVTLPV